MRGASSAERRRPRRPGRSSRLAGLIMACAALAACPQGDDRRPCATGDECPGLVPCTAGRCTPQCASDDDCDDGGLGRRCLRGGCTDLDFDGDFLVAIAHDPVVDEGAEVFLDASGSRYIGDGALQIAWEQAAGPAVELVGADGLLVRFVAPDVTDDTDVVLRLTLGDGAATSSAEATLTVRNARNRVPVVIVQGPDGPVSETAFVRLDARATFDPDPDDTLTFSWVQFEGPAVELADLPTDVAGSLKAFTAPAVDSLVSLAWSVTATDSQDGSASAETRVFVRPFSTVPCESVADCIFNDPCVVVRCVGGLCLDSVLPWCCRPGERCDDGDPCTDDRCREGVGCTHEPLAGCCADDADCPDPGPCQRGRCDGDGVCTSAWIDGCCQRDTDCPSDGPCQRGICTEGRCDLATVEGCCEDDTACDDGDRCTEDRCDELTGRCRHRALRGCCDDQRDCLDPSACTADECIDGRCRRGPIDGCCSSDEDCNDGDPCTDDACDGGTGRCSHARRASCCADAHDCVSSGRCFEAVCSNRSCVEVLRDDCCSAAGTAPGGGPPCDDGDPCTVDFCDPASGRCAHAVREGCCADDASCDDGRPCTLDRCQTTTRTCTHLPIRGCCGGDADCDDRNPCTADACVDGRCAHVADRECCASNTACSDATPCTADLCDPATRSCDHVPITGCCREDADCAALTRPCATARCSALEGRCVFDRDPACCSMDEGLVDEADGDDLSDCGTGGPCVARICDGARCRGVDLPSCCTGAADCDDGDPCTADGCADGECTHEAIAGCCRTRADCPAAGRCVEVRCDVATGACSEQDAPDCCVSDEDCGDLNPCTVDRCADGRCVHDPDPSCCLVGRDCVAPGPCDGFVCRANECAEATLAQCCDRDATCEDGDPCTLGWCDLRTNTCVEARVPACCRAASDCDDGDPCTVDRCEADACVHEPAAEGCCADAGDCDDGDPCTADVCLPASARCAHLPDATCCARDTDCPSSACAAGSCDALNLRCVAIPTEGCCRDDADCPTAPCSPSICVEGQCTLSTRGGCCATAADCDDGNPCTADRCDDDGSCAHAPSNAGAVCDDGRAATVADLCDAAGRCAGFYAWGADPAGADSRLQALDDHTGAAVGSRSIGGDVEAFAVIPTSGPTPFLSAVASGGALVDVDRGYAVTADGAAHVLTTDSDGVLAPSPSLSDALAAIGAAPWSAARRLDAVPPDVERLLVVGPAFVAASCTDVAGDAGDAAAAWRCDLESVPGAAAVAALTPGASAGVTAWAAGRDTASRAHIWARVTTPDGALWSDDAPAGCGREEAPCPGGPYAAMATDPVALRGWAASPGGQLAVWTAGSGWIAATSPVQDDDDGASETTSLAVGGSLLWAAGLARRCTREDAGGVCSVEERRWWVRAGVPVAGPDVGWRARHDLAIERCGPGLGTPCPAADLAIGPSDVAWIERDGSLRIAGAHALRAARSRALLFWRAGPRHPF